MAYHLRSRGPKSLSGLQDEADHVDVDEQEEDGSNGDDDNGDEYQEGKRGRQRSGTVTQYEL